MHLDTFITRLTLITQKVMLLSCLVLFMILTHIFSTDDDDDDDDDVLQSRLV